MKQIVTCKEMKALDGNMIEGIGIPSCVLMERAALKVAEELERMLADKKQEERILCVCGSGNNGGDGVAVACIWWGIRTTGLWKCSVSWILQLPVRCRL